MQIVPLKGSFTIFLFLVRSHILNINGVWYSWFWLEGPKNAPNSIFGGFKFNLPWRCESRSPALRVKVPCAASRGPMWRCESRSLGANLKPQKIEFGAFLGPSGQNHLYHTPLLFKIWDLTKNKKIVNDPFKNTLTPRWRRATQMLTLSTGCSPFATRDARVWLRSGIFHF